MILMVACLVGGCLQEAAPPTASPQEPGFEVVAAEGVRADVLLWMDDLLLCGGTIDHGGQPEGLWCPTDKEPDGRPHTIRLRATYATTGATREDQWEIQDSFARFVVTRDGPTRA